MEQNTLWVNKESSLGHKIGQQKSSVVILLALVLVAYVLSVCVAFFLKGAAFSIAQPLLFLAVGAFHAARMENDFASLTATQKWLYTFIVGASIFLLFWIASFWGIHFSFLTMVAGAVAFFLPFVLSELAKTYMQLTIGNASLWQAPNESSSNFPDVYFKGIPLRFRLMDADSGSVFLQTEFRPLFDMKLGDVFYDMLQKQNKKSVESVNLFNEDKQPYHWLFFSGNFPGLRRVLDPGLSLEENGLKKGSVVYAQRISPDSLVITKEQKAVNLML